MPEVGVRNWGARGGLFIGARGGEGGERWRAPAEMVAHSGEDGMARADARRQTELVDAIMARRRGEQWPVAIASLAPVTNVRKALTGGARSLERDRERARGVRADGRGRPVSWGAARHAGGTWAAWARGRGGRRAGGSWAGNGPTGGGRRFFFFFSIFYFLFLFSISISFIPFSYEQIIS
jgi:hypothetical protein